MIEILEKIYPLLQEKKTVYLVGGAVRNQLLGIPTHDLDFAVDGDAIPLARKVADNLGAAYYPLDYDRDTGRVVITRENSNHDMLDFSRLRGDDLISDLQDRDFTINAMALDVRDPKTLIDPLNGALDLRAKRIRACSPQSIKDDPIRILRAVRFGNEFGFHIDPETRRLIREAVPLLPIVSPERQRDELLRILAGKKSAVALRTLDILDVLPQIFPELNRLKGVSQSAPHIYDVWNHTLQTISSLEMLLGVLAVTDYDPVSASNLVAGLAVLRLGRYRQQFYTHINDFLVDDRPWYSLLKFAALYHDIGKPDTRSEGKDGRIHFLQHEKIGADLIEQRARDLRLSSHETARLKTIIQHHMRIHHLVLSGNPPTRRTIYRFFRDTKETGVEIILLTLADVLAMAGSQLAQETWTQYLDIARTCLEAWWETRDEKIFPQRLLNGHDLMDEFSLEPGPQIGVLLSRLQEFQACGEIKTREEALTFVRRWLSNKN